MGRLSQDFGADNFFLQSRLRDPERPRKEQSQFNSDIGGVEGGSWISVDTPYGAPSDQIFTGTLNGIEVAFLPRHGRGHIHSPSHVPYQANIYALKGIGVTDILAVWLVAAFVKI